VHRFIRKLFAKSVPAPVAKTPARPRLGLEGLETREVLSTATLAGGVLTVNGTAGSDAFQIRAADANSVEVLDNGVTIANFPFSSPVLSRIDVNGLAGSDTLAVTSLPALVGNGRLNVTGVEQVFVGKNVGTAAAPKFSLADVRSELSVGGATFLNLRCDGDAAGRFVNVSSSSVTGLAPKAVFFSLGSASDLDLRTGDGGDFVNVNGTFSGGQVRLFTNGGSDTVNVAANNSNLVVNAGDGDDTLNVAPVFKSLDPINGRIDFFGGAGHDELQVNDQNAPGLSPNLPAISLYNAVVSANQITRSVDSLQVGLPFHEAATVGYTDTEVVGFAAETAPMAFQSHVRVAGTSAATFISAGAEDVVVGDGGRLDGVRGALTVNRATLGGTLTLDDSAQTAGKTYTLGATSVTEPGVIVVNPGLPVAAAVAPTGFFPLPPSLSVSFNDNVRNVRLLAGGGSDKINVVGTRAGTAGYDVNGGGGSDTLTAPNRNNVFGLTTGNSGVLNTTVAFSNVENLVGNAKDDRFVFAFNFGVIDGRIDGGGGKFDTLDYSMFAIPVVVNLAAGSATHVGGGLAGRVTGIENVYGGNAADVLIGDAGSNVLVGNGGSDFIVGGGGADLLVGGAGTDTLSDATGTAIYVGGTVKGALTTDAGLKAVVTEWARTDLPGTPDQQFAAKALHLKFGGGLNGAVRLDGTTLAADHQADRLDPNPAATADDLFVIDLQDTFTGVNTPSAVETQQRIVVI
jgi:hypothetical protein